jgi:glucose/arabinose dehydrogenase
MQRFIALIAGAAVLAGLGVLLVAEGPSPTAASGSTPMPAAGTRPAGDSSGLASATTVSASASAGTTPPAVALRRLGTFDQPVYLTSPPGDTSRLFVVEKTGRIRVLKNGSVLAAPFLDISSLVSDGGEQGLLSMAFDPAYGTNRRFYVDYTDVNGDTRVVRYRSSASNPDVAVPSGAKVLLRVDQPYANHNGGQLAFSPSGRLFVGMGDGGSGGDPQRHAQDPRSRLGKLLRLNVDVSPVRVGIYARGLRNPWRFSFDRATGSLWIGDVGQDAWEEIDYLRPGRPAGANLGWNGYEGTHVLNAQVAGTLNKSSLTWPVAEYSHSLGEAVTGGYVYRGSAIPALRGFYLFADFASGHVWAKKGPSGARRALSGADGQATQISSFGQDASGELYVVSLAGPVYKIVPR